MDLARPLIHEWNTGGRKLAVIALDLPGNGYTSMVDHRAVADVMEDGTTRLSEFTWHDGSFVAYFPVLDFLDNSVVAFVNSLSRWPYPNLKSQIKIVAGGSLGGNLGLRLSLDFAHAHAFFCWADGWPIADRA
jgi:pimeloyl-ACP methyl ester carboxylesterase